jgi:hypothetical protein
MFELFLLLLPTLSHGLKTNNINTKALSSVHQPNPSDYDLNSLKYIFHHSLKKMILIP